MTSSAATGGAFFVYAGDELANRLHFWISETHWGLVSGEIYYLRKGMLARRLHVLLCRLETQVNHKRARQVYRESGLMIRRKKRRQCVRLGQPLGAWTASWLASFQQRPLKAGGRLVKHARYYWLLLAEEPVAFLSDASVGSRCYRFGTG